jgi:glycerol-3-phosphate acyltransferase PlsY
MIIEIILAITAYLLGSIPTGLLLARSFGVDIRTAGSGNIGATNVYRTLGKKVGILTLIGDCIKGLVPVLAAKYLGMSSEWIALVGLSAFLGHVYTVFLGFKGGKGVATALGVFLGISPITMLFAFAVFALVLWKWRFVSLASILAAATAPAILAITEKNLSYSLMAVVLAAIVILRHRDNIGRMRSGTENKFKTGQ